MTTKEPAWKKFLKLKTEVPVATANIADSVNTAGTKRKRDALDAEKPKSALKKKSAVPVKTVDSAEKKVKANKQKKKAKTKVKRSKKDEAESKAAQMAALEYLSLYTSARTEWKFSKQRQNYLLKHIYDDAAIPDARYAALLTYLSSLQGGAKTRCCDEANEMVQRYERQQESTEADAAEHAETEQDDEEGDKEEEEEVKEEQYERAKKVVETLSESNNEQKDED